MKFTHWISTTACWICLTLTVNLCSAEEEPALPLGLGSHAEDTEPGLPVGMDSLSSTQQSSSQPHEDTNPINLSGFWELRAGTRTQSDPHVQQSSLREARLQTRLTKYSDRADLRLVTDFLFDDLEDDHGIELENGQGYVDLRELNALFRVSDIVDVRLGRQILTWGTGDLIFINDLFPKDYQSFFLGRDLTYLKAPSDALKLTASFEGFGLDVVYTPRFDADRYLDGSRLSFFNPLLGKVSGEDNVTSVVKPDQWFEDDEIALRLFGESQGVEWAAYAYDGYWKSPAGVDDAQTRRLFPRLRALGASVRGAVAGGIGNLELGWYDSRDDDAGTDANLPNSEMRFLLGYHRELRQNFNMGLQYYLRHMQGYGAYRDNLPPGSPSMKQNRHLLTLRMDWLLLQKDLHLSVFTFYSPSDDDAYLRATANFKVNDNWTLESGINQLKGKDHTMFGQLEENSNLYFSLRYNFSDSR